jgi:type IV pilus assembly protein PilA
MLDKLLKRVNKEEKGFTLIELLAVIVILGIIAVIAIPMIGGIITNSKNDSDLATARQIYDASRMYIIGEENGVFIGGTAAAPAAKTVTLTQLVADGYMEAGLVLPSTKIAITQATVTYSITGTLASVTLAPAPVGATAGVYSAAQVLASDLKAVTPPVTPPAGG